MVVASKVRAREFEINWRSVLPPQLAPDIKSLRNLITAQLHGCWKQGTMLYETGFNTRIYKFLLYDEAFVEKIKGKAIKHEASDKKVYSVKIHEVTKAQSKYKNPKNVTITGVQFSDLVLLENAGFDQFFGEYGKIINETQDVYHRDDETFTTGKKRLRIDLEKEIPRSIQMSIEVDDGRVISGRITVYYAGQKYFCKRCDSHHVGDCPQFIRMKEEKANAQKIKEELTKTVFVGDSNLRHLNENALLAEGVCMSGAKLGHVANQLKFQKLDNRSCVVLFAGANNVVNDLKEEELKDWQGQVTSEIKSLENDLKTNVTSKGKQAVIVELPALPMFRSTVQKKQRATINSLLNGVAANLKKATDGAQARCIRVDDAVSGKHFDDGIHVSATLLEMICAQVNEIENIRSPSLKGNMTCEKIYSSVGTVYPLGCTLCTKLNHHPNDCRANLGSGLKRHHSDGGDTTPMKMQKNNGYFEIVGK